MSKEEWEKLEIGDVIVGTDIVNMASEFEIVQIVKYINLSGIAFRSKIIKAGPRNDIGTFYDCFVHEYYEKKNTSRIFNIEG